MPKQQILVQKQQIAEQPKIPLYELFRKALGSIDGIEIIASDRFPVGKARTYTTSNILTVSEIWIQHTREYIPMDTLSGVLARHPEIGEPVRRDRNFLFYDRRIEPQERPVWDAGNKDYYDRVIVTLNPILL